MSRPKAASVTIIVRPHTKPSLYRDARRAKKHSWADGEEDILESVAAMA